MSTTATTPTKRPHHDSGSVSPATSPKRFRQTLLLSSTLVPSLPSLPPETTISSPLTDRSSRFLGLFLPLSSPRLLPTAKLQLTSSPEISSATHRILAWVVDEREGYDDDGEKFAGQRVLDVLRGSGFKGVVCVARWFGGEMLGPVRFRHVVHVTADALAEYSLRIQRETKAAKETAMTEDARDRVLRVLGARDRTVETLREMIAQKKLEKGLCPVNSPSKPRVYSNMSLETLQRQLTARDSAIKTLREILTELTATPSPA
jgi:Uncharacterized protein family UPF0029